MREGQFEYDEKEHRTEPSTMATMLNQNRNGFPFAEVLGESVFCLEKENVMISGHCFEIKAYILDIMDTMDLVTGAKGLQLMKIFGHFYQDVKLSVSSLHFNLIQTGAKLKVVYEALKAPFGIFCSCFNRALGDDKDTAKTPVIDQSWKTASVPKDYRMYQLAEQIVASVVRKSPRLAFSRDVQTSCRVLKVAR